MFRVKICGVTSAQDALLAAACGADAIGINFYKGSRRYVPVSEAAPIIAAARGKAVVVAVFVNELPEVMEEACRLLRIDVVQLSGNEPAAAAQRLCMKRIKAIHVRDGTEIPANRNYPCEAFLVDASVPGEYGGTGKTLDWGKIGVGKPEKPWILAGGLTAGNVATAIRIARPDGVDVASGVETLPGKKDPMKVRSFINIARQAFDDKR